LLGDQGAGQIVPPGTADERMAQRLPQVGSDAHREAHALQVIRANDGDCLDDGRGGKARRVDRRVGDGEHFTGEGGIGRDELAQLVKLHVLVVGQLQDANGDLGKWRQAKMRPWRNDGRLRGGVGGHTYFVGWNADNDNQKLLSGRRGGKLCRLAESVSGRKA
jgi:hypothetical protein